MKPSIALLAAIIAVATAQQETYEVASNAGPSLADVPANCNKADFAVCISAYPDLSTYLTCTHPSACACAGDQAILACLDAHCTDSSQYPESLTSYVKECTAAGKNDFIGSGGWGGDVSGSQARGELRSRVDGPGGGLLEGDGTFPVGPSCTRSSLTTCVSGLTQKYASCVDPFAPCLCSALFDIQACYTASCTSESDQPQIVTSNISQCQAPLPVSTTTTTTSSSSSSSSVATTTTTTSLISTSITTTTSTPLPSVVTGTISPTSTVTSTTTRLLTAYLPTQTPLTSPLPVYTVSYSYTYTSVSLSLSLSTGSSNTYKQIEYTSTTSTSTTLVPSTTTTVQTTTTRTASSSAAAGTLALEMGIGAVAAAALGFAAML